MVGRLLAAFAVLLGALLAPLGLGAATAWLLVPTHLLFAIVCGAGAIGAAIAGQPWRARLYGAGYLAACGLAVLALGWGSDARGGSWYWMAPWAICLLWAWIPPVVAMAATWVAGRRRAGLTRRVVRRRVRARRALTSAPPTATAAEPVAPSER
jgi:hypothetical protein